MLLFFFKASNEKKEESIDIKGSKVQNNNNTIKKDYQTKSKKDSKNQKEKIIKSQENNGNVSQENNGNVPSENLNKLIVFYSKQSSNLEPSSQPEHGENPINSPSNFSITFLFILSFNSLFSNFELSIKLFISFISSN